MIRGRRNRDEADAGRPRRERVGALGRLVESLLAVPRPAAPARDADLRRAEARLIAVFEESHDGAFVAQDGRFVMVNRAFAAIVGREPAEMADMAFADVVAPEHLTAWTARFERRIAGEEFGGVYEIELLRRDGSRATCLQQARRFDNDGRPAVLGAIKDVTDERRAERELAARRALMETALEHMRHGMVVLDADMRIVARNRAALDLFRLDGEKFCEGAPYLDALREMARRGDFGPGDPDALARKRLVMLPDEGEAQFERETPEGRFLVTRRVRLPDGGWVFTYDDVTEARQRTRRLAESEDRLRQVMDNAGEAILTIDAAGGVGSANPAAHRMFGYEPGEMIGAKAASLFGRDAARGEADVEALLRAGPRRIAGVAREIEARRKDGSTFPADFSLGEFAVSGRGRMLVAMLRDLSERKAVEAQLRQSQKLEQLGRLTGGIAHDFNNLLTVILGNAETLIESSRDDDAGGALAGQILRAAEAAADLTGSLLAFARRQALQPRHVSVNEFVARIDGLLRRALGGGVDVRLDLARDAWPAVIDPAQLESAVLNLAVNARDAMEGRGRLTIETRNVALDSAYAEANLESRPGDFVMVAVTDDGAGIPPETLKHVFEPFFTTKEAGRGTGLGLAMVYGFVRQSGGHVKIYSEVGQGTTVRMYLPRSEREADAPATATPPTRTPRGRGETVLAVEDDELVRGYVAAQLRQLGYDVAEASRGDEALEVLARAGRIDLLFTDIVMPGGLGGPELAQRARRMRPGLRVLFTSGYTPAAAVHHGRLDDGDRLLSKPYRLHDLAVALRGALDAADAAPDAGDAAPGP